jgi:sulfide:quinone oxidoreductase
MTGLAASRTLLTMAESPLRVLIAGAGVAAFEAALALRDLDRIGVTVELVAPEQEFVYRPLAVAAPFRMGDVKRFPLQRLVEAAGATLTQAAVRQVDADRKLVTTDDGQELPYDALLLALGAEPLDAIEGAFTFRGPQDQAEFGRLLEQARSGGIRRLVFALPDEPSWPMPLYELALLTRVHLADAGAEEVTVEIVTPEAAPLELFGVAASDAIRELLKIRGIELTLNTVSTAVDDGWLQVSPGDSIRADRVIALPRLEGPRIEGIPHNEHGFVEVDQHGAVWALKDIWAAGDLTSFPIKQGGLAAQQAEVAAQSIAARAGADVDPRPFNPVLRGLLLTGLSPRYIRAEPTAEQFAFDTEPLWWPPAKIVGRYLAPFLATELGFTPPDVPLDHPAGVEVAVALQPPQAQ